MGGLAGAGVPGLKPLVVLGATGSIGSQTFEVAGVLGLDIAAIAARRGSDELFELTRRYPGARVVVAAPTPSEKERFAQLGDRVAFGPDAVASAAGVSGQIVVNGIVGSAGLAPTIAALEAGNRVALANKESLVAGGPIVQAAAKTPGAELIPVDSEHSALAQLLAADDRGVARVILTASGGPFRGRAAADLDAVTPRDALSHPTWEMGRRISVDSATLMNKGFEVIEAHFLFGLDYDAIDVVVHPQSIVHAMVEYVDGSLTAHMGHPDMRMPIQAALTWPERSAMTWSPLGVPGLTLGFEAPDRAAFPCLDLAYAAGRMGGSAPAVLNAADEIAVEAFLAERIGFGSIPVVVSTTLEKAEHRPLTGVDDVLAADADARAIAWDVIGTSC